LGSEGFFLGCFLGGGDAVLSHFFYFELHPVLVFFFCSAVCISWGWGLFCHVCCFPLLFVNCILIISSACLMAGGDAIAGASLWDRMVRHEPAVFIPRTEFFKQLLLDNYQPSTEASAPPAPAGFIPTVTVASGNLVRGVDPGLLVMTPLTGRYFNLLRGEEVCCLLSCVLP